LDEIFAEKGKNKEVTKLVTEIATRTPAMGDALAILGFGVTCSVGDRGSSGGSFQLAVEAGCEWDSEAARALPIAVVGNNRWAVKVARALASSCSRLMLAVEALPTEK
jgi:hypothetical protein